MKEYRTYAITIDMSEATEGDYNDFRRQLDQLETDFPGVHLLGSDVTEGWPTYRIHGARRAADSEGAAWVYDPSYRELKVCPECSHAALEGEASCTICGCEPSDDTTWREQRTARQRAADSEGPR